LVCRFVTQLTSRAFSPLKVGGQPVPGAGCRQTFAKGVTRLFHRTPARGSESSTASAAAIVNAFFGAISVPEPERIQPRWTSGTGDKGQW
jgi:hypothetical protein